MSAARQGFILLSIPPPHSGDCDLTPQEAQAIVGVTKRKLQYWVRVGLLFPRFTELGHIVFDDSDLLDIKTIKLLLEQGYSLQRVRRIRKSLKGEFQALSELNQNHLKALV